MSCQCDRPPIYHVLVSPFINASFFRCLCWVTGNCFLVTFTRIQHCLGQFTTIVIAWRLLAYLPVTLLCVTSSFSTFQAAGKYHQRGRNYVVEDGDIIFFKFNTGGLKKKWDWACLVLIMVLYIQMAACFVCTHLWFNYFPLSFFIIKS